MPRRVFVHVGLPKTGTSSIQRTLWLSQQRLAQQGVAVPGEHHSVQRRAVWDLIGRRVGPDEPLVPGSWRALVDQIQSGTDPTVVLSEEFLVHARRSHVRRVVRDLRPAEVHIVITIRDLTRVIGSMWQHEVSQGATWPWAEFVAAVRDPEQGPPTAGVGFWLRYDLRHVLALWAGVVPADRIHVVVVPPEGAAQSLLLDRFAQAIGVDPTELTPPERMVNTSVGVAETEVIRRLNMSLDGQLNERQYIRVFDRAVKPAFRARDTSARLKMPDEFRGWLTEYSADVIRFLQESPYTVVGDLDDLRPHAIAFEGDDPAEVPESELTEVALLALTGTIEQYAAFWWRARRRKEADEVDLKTRIVSSGRALGFKARSQAFELAHHNRVFARAARMYLRRRSSRH